MFVKALKRYDFGFRKALLNKLETENSAHDAIRNFFQFQVDRAKSKDGWTGWFLTNTALELAVHDPEVGEIVAASQNDIKDFFFRMIETGQRTGDIPATIQTTDLSRSLLGVMIGLFVLSRSRPERPLLQSTCDDALARLN